ncbi:MAG: outer membrane beta-barrel protein [Hyphomicrobium sp.]
MKALSFLAATFVLFFGSSAAFAGGALTDYGSPPANACGGPFSGFYGGGILGLGGLSSKADVAPFNLKDNDRGFTIGGIGGYNWQCNGRLLGIESDISYFNANAIPGLDAPGCEGCNERLNFGSEVDWYGTLRARVGIVGDQNFLVFATGGLAYGGIDHSMSASGTENFRFFSSSDTQIGWTAGGGVDYLLSDHWAFRADALYVDLGSEDHTFTVTPGGCDDPDESCSLRAKWNDGFWVARVGLTYLFGAPSRDPVVYDTPLK